MKEKVVENEKELAYSTIKVEELINKIKDIEYLLAVFISIVLRKVNSEINSSMKPKIIKI